MKINDYTYIDAADPTISMPHGIGFVLGTMIWDMWAFIAEYGFDSTSTMELEGIIRLSN
jgi:hypothetical protein